MVAPTAKTLPIPPSAIAGRGVVHQFDVNEALGVLRCGEIPEDASLELLNGFLVHIDRSAVGGDSTMHSPGHRKSVRKLTALAAHIDTATRHVQIQSPIICGKRQMPEPDFAIVKGSDDDYTDRLPAAADTHCVIEVADSSWERDRNEKLPIYAQAGVPQYIILNLRSRSAEVFERPSEET
ncbi:MAG: Uma2 family endonuclease, partial [Phycisphaerae bacterium]|nr:Uma2 family endonuclease [Phycisphaerae bacterium]